METSVRLSLSQLSADFYRFHAKSFDESRQNPWDSWQQILKSIEAIASPRSVIDLGCGNGRFAAFLYEHLGLYEHQSGGINYTGIDSEAQLINNAQHRYPSGQFYVESIESALMRSENFHFLACFGVFHHLPGAQFRSEIFNRLENILIPGGIAAVSLWQPKRLKNFATKFVTKHDVEGLEANDYLFGWKGDFSRLRYCHHFEDHEINDLVANSPFQLVTEFQGVGNDQSNRYLVLQKPL